MITQKCRFLFGSFIQELEWFEQTGTAYRNGEYLEGAEAEEYIQEKVDGIFSALA